MHDDTDKTLKQDIDTDIKMLSDTVAALRARAAREPLGVEARAALERAEAELAQRRKVRSELGPSA